MVAEKIAHFSGFVAVIDSEQPGIRRWLSAYGTQAVLLGELLVQPFDTDPIQFLEAAFVLPLPCDLRILFPELSAPFAICFTDSINIFIFPSLVVDAQFLWIIPLPFALD